KCAGDSADDGVGKGLAVTATIRWALPPLIAAPLSERLVISSVAEKSLNSRWWALSARRGWIIARVRRYNEHPCVSPDEAMNARPMGFAQLVMSSGAEISLALVPKQLAQGHSTAGSASRSKPVSLCVTISSVAFRAQLHPALRCNAHYRSVSGNDMPMRNSPSRRSNVHLRAALNRSSCQYRAPNRARS